MPSILQPGGMPPKNQVPLAVPRMEIVPVNVTAPTEVGIVIVKCPVKSTDPEKPLPPMTEALNMVKGPSVALLTGGPTIVPTPGTVHDCVPEKRPEYVPS